MGTRAGWDLVGVDFGRDGSLADEALAYGEHVVVLEPADLREFVIKALKESA